MRVPAASRLLVVASALMLTAATGYQVNNGADTDITEHTVCKNVANAHASGQAIFVPTNTSTEWSAFYTNPPSGVTIGTCAASGAAYCWGYNNSGQLGTGNTTQRTSPSLVAGGYTNWTKVDAGGWFSCGIRTSGQAYCWGEALNGKLGNATTTPNVTSPGLVQGSWTDWTDISAGVEHACGIRNGTAYCWGDGPSGQIGNGGTADRTSPTLVSGGFTDWFRISAGEAISCGLRGSGIAYCWGSATNGTLGNNTTTPNLSTPSLVLGGFTDWIDIAAGRNNVCGVRSNGKAYCWGDGASSQIGDGATADRVTPSLVLGGFTDWETVNSYYNHTCGIRNSTMYCWGTAANGQLGNGTTTPNRTTPTIVSGGFTNWTKLSSGGYYSCGIQNGVTRCWGLNTNGWLGDGSTTQRTSPSIVLGGWSDWQAVEAAGSHSCGIR